MPSTARSGGQTKVRHTGLRIVLRHQDIIGFQLSVIDPIRMTMMHGIEDLAKHPLHHIIVSDKSDLVRADEIVERTTWAVVENEVDEVFVGLGGVERTLG